MNLVEYHFDFRGKPLTMVGRPDVDSDSAIISMIFVREMFSLDRFPQTEALTRYLTAQQATGRRPFLLDAGANIGAASLYFSHLFPSLKTVAVEPDAANAMLARRNLAALDAEVVEGALGRELGTMFINDVDFGPISYRVGSTGNKPVSSHTVPSLLERLDEKQFPFIAKIDIEGGEDDLFAEDADWLDQFPLVVIELHDWMLPHQHSSRSFLRNISRFDFDILTHGENTFCYNNRLLAPAS